MQEWDMDLVEHVSAKLNEELGLAYPDNAKNAPLP